MKVWSKGLGKTELFADCRYYEVSKDPDSDQVCIIGNITDPVNWEFRAVIGPEDIPGFMKLGLNLNVLKLLLKNMHRYIGYLLNRNQYKDPSHENLEEKVATAYERMMKGRSRPDHLRA